MIRLSQTSPTGRRNPYRTRWASVDGVTYKVEADWLNSPWTVWRGDLDDILDAMSPEEMRRLGAQGAVDQTECIGIAFNLTEAREMIEKDASRLTD